MKNAYVVNIVHEEKENGIQREKMRAVCFLNVKAKLFKVILGGITL